MTLIDLVKEFEGFSLVPYQDVAGVWTIGYGHALSLSDAKLYGTGISRDQAEAFLKDDLAYAQRQVDRLVNVPLTKGQNTALVDFVFNLGSGRLQSSTLLKLLNKGKYDDAAQQFKRWVFADGKPMPGLVRRRAKEMEIFLS